MDTLLFSVSGVAEQIGGKEIWHAIKFRHVYTALYRNNKFTWFRENTVGCTLLNSIVKDYLHDNQC